MRDFVIVFSRISLTGLLGVKCRVSRRKYGGWEEEMQIRRGEMEQGDMDTTKVALHATPEIPVPSAAAR